MGRVFYCSYLLEILLIFFIFWIYHSVHKLSLIHSNLITSVFVMWSYIFKNIWFSFMSRIQTLQVSPQFHCNTGTHKQENAVKIFLAFYHDIVNKLNIQRRRYLKCHIGEWSFLIQVGQTTVNEHRVALPLKPMLIKPS